MATYCATVAYDGTEFAGFQVQADRRTVQGTLQEGIARVSGEVVHVDGAGRTDAGVHATGQVVSFRTERARDPVALRRALDAVLPSDLAIVALGPAPPEFHARYSARARAYRYTIRNAPERAPLERRHAWHRREPLDEVAMDAAARGLLGCHDFAAFGNAPANPGRSTVRTVFRCRCWRDGERVAIEVVANAFLPRMVRNVVGALERVGVGQCAPDAIAAILASRDRARAGRPAPPQGLCLTGVWYD